ncbi:hypothetical protein POVCU2_0043990 [Plasmodium ovale curtisi]|uniref:Uncharacterized protein n=1 Tax=Plasmodium ovale curtisi TaxID=864141 RepID=A0A1A8W448_PLAOA|nr:hypothetical protein POVCU2_0043990 [Plasmodium ovale curtisi]SBS97749.1 hypothetical protein POVCU1_040650 [Plasmodium ovale curtisi]
MTKENKNASGRRLLYGSCSVVLSFYVMPQHKAGSVRKGEGKRRNNITKQYEKIKKNEKMRGNAQNNMI